MSETTEEYPGVAAAWSRTFGRLRIETRHDSIELDSEAANFLARFLKINVLRERDR